MQAGETIRDYILEEKIGAGGVGEVWRARHNKLDKIVAVKFMFAHLAQDPDFQDRFLREAVTMANLDHPNIVSVTDYFSKDDQHCLVMTHVECGSLRDWIKEKSRFSEAETLQIGAQMLSALNFAHQRGVIHRDVKPSNILMDIDGVSHLTDFGIVLLTSEQRLTTTGTFMGTVEYMSPEQIQAVKDVTGNSDQYSCGCVLYEMLTGHPPCGSRDGGDTEFTIMRRHTNEAPPGLRELNPAISVETETAIMRSLEKDPAKRFANCDEMIQALSLSSVQPVSGAAPRLGDSSVDPVVSARSSSIVVPKALSDKAISSKRANIQIPKTQPPVQQPPTEAAAQVPESDTVVSNQQKDFFPVTEKLTAEEVAAQKQSGQPQPFAQPDQAQRQPPGKVPPQLAANAAANSKSGNKKGTYAILLSLAIFSGSALAYVLLKDTFHVRSLLTKAEKAYAMGDYESPEGRGALDYYKKALTIDHDNETALKGVNRLADHYLDLSKQAAAKNQYAKADTYADDASKLADLHPSLTPISVRVEADRRIRVAEAALEQAEAENEKVKQLEEEKLSLLEAEKEKLLSEKEKLSSERLRIQSEKRNLKRQEELARIKRRREESRLNQQRLALRPAQKSTKRSTGSSSRQTRVEVGTPSDTSVIKATPMKVVKKQSTAPKSEQAKSRNSDANNRDVIKPTRMASRKTTQSPRLDPKPVPTARSKAAAEPAIKPKTKAEINKEVKNLYKKGRALLGKRGMTFGDLRQAKAVSQQIDDLSTGHKLGKKVETLTLRACYTLGRKTLKAKSYDETQDIIDFGLSINAKDKRIKKLQKLLDRQSKRK